jgi:hypothetical protein
VGLAVKVSVGVIVAVKVGVMVRESLNWLSLQQISTSGMGSDWPTRANEKISLLLINVVPSMDAGMGHH